MDKSKPFGLIISKRAQTRRPAASAVFGSDSDDEPSAKKKKMPSIPQAKPKKMPLPEMSEDPSIYEYDSIYDDMKAQEVAKVAPKDTSKPSRYIGSLLKAADKRKKDQERRVEKKVHHERELEGDKFADKEAFVTSAYKKKMQEMEEEEERERRENMLNEMMDVTKQKDLSGFYRHFLKQSVGEESVPVFGERHIKKEQDGVVVKQEKVSDEEGKDSATSRTCERETEKALGGNVGQDTDMGSSRHGVSQPSKGAGKSSSEKDSTGSVDSSMSKWDNKDPLVKNKKHSDEDAGSVDSAMPRRNNEEEAADGDVDRDTDMGSSSDEDGVSGKVDKPLKAAVVEKSSNKKDGGIVPGGSVVPGMDRNKKSLDADVDRDTDSSSSSDEDFSGDKFSQQSKGVTVKKSPQKSTLTEKAKSSLDDNVDRDTDIESSSDEEAIHEKVIQPSTDIAIGKSSKMNAHKEKSSSLVDNVDKDSDSSGEDESGKTASCSPLKAVFRKPFPKKESPRKRSENSEKQSRNIRKRAEDVDSSPGSGESSSTSDDETDKEPKANGGSKEKPSILESVEQVKAQPPKPKVDIYAKRTVGDVFADAQVRYFQRMAARST